MIKLCSARVSSYFLTFLPQFHNCFTSNSELFRLSFTIVSPQFPDGFTSDQLMFEPLFLPTAQVTQHGSEEDYHAELGPLVAAQDVVRRGENTTTGISHVAKTWGV